MTIYVSIIGIDGSGKSTVTAALADLAPAELGVTAASVGDDFRCKTPDEDLLLPGFAPDGEMLAARLGRFFRRGAKATTDHRRLYPPLKLAHLAMQERTAREIEARYHPDLIFCDGSLILSSAGRAINYVKADDDAFPADPCARIQALYDHVVEGRPQPPMRLPPLPGLNLMRRLHRLDQWLRLSLMELPEAVIFLDITPEAALARRMASSRKLDGHENLHDLSQARTMYQGVVEFFRRRRGDDRVLVVDATHLSVEETLKQAVEFVCTLLVRNAEQEAEAAGERLGTTRAELSKKTSVFKKVLSYRYLGRYVLPNLRRGSAQELTFPLSSLGQLLLREGYSAGVMKAIYLQDSQEYGLLDRAFLDYPLHRAVYDRLQILKPAVEKELRQRLAALPPGRKLRIFTAPSGFAFDLFQPLARIAQSGGAQLDQIHVLASDLDPDGRIEQELTGVARQLGIGFEFVRGDLTSDEMRERLRSEGPYDVIMFVGLSGWLPKTHLVRHLKLLRGSLAEGGVLFTDCFIPDAFALSGKYVGYKANYYAPRDFTHLLAYCGFDPAEIAWASGRDKINHVCVARTRPDGAGDLLQPGFPARLKVHDPVLA